jgi:hypothetical protein
MVKKIFSHFNNFSGKVPGDEGAQTEEKKKEEAAGKKDFTLYKELQTRNGKKGHQIFYQFLTKVFDCQYS